MKKGKSWKTTIAGILTIAAPVAHLLFPAVITPEISAAIASIAIGGGLVSAKDGNVTGGTVTNK